VLIVNELGYEMRISRNGNGNEVVETWRYISQAGCIAGSGNTTLY